MGRYQYELSHCNETSCCYKFGERSSTWCNIAYTSSFINLCASASTCGGLEWDKPTGIIRWNTSIVNNWNHVRSVRKLIDCNDPFYRNDMRICNDFPTDRIVIASMYGFVVQQTIGSQICWQMMPVGQRQMFILPSGCTVCYCMACNVVNFNKLPNGSYVYNGCFPGSDGDYYKQGATAPYFMSVESYPLPVLNSNGHMGENGACQFVSPTAICSTGTAASDIMTIPVCTSGYIDCCPSCFRSLNSYSEGPALKGPLMRANSLRGKLSADSNSSAKDAYVLVSACGWWAGEQGVPDNVAMTIMNWSFPMGGAIWSPYETGYNAMARAMHKITWCRYYNEDEGVCVPVYGPKYNYELMSDYAFCLPNDYVDTRVWFNVPPKSDKLVTHITDNADVYCEQNYFGCICAYSTLGGSCNPPWLCNPLGYWTYKWNNGNSYYAVNTHCT